MKADPKKFQRKRLDCAINNEQVTWLKKRKIENQNIVHKLKNRSMKINNLSYRKFYQCITPNFTVCDVKKPPCFLRKFSPCGKYLIAFSSTQTSVEIYDYLGAAGANSILYYCPIPLGDTVLKGKDPIVRHVLNNIFSRLLKLRSSVEVCENQEQLNRECSIFTSDGEYIIVCSSRPRDLASSRPLLDTNRNNESVTPNPRSPLDDYTFHMVKLSTGVCTSQITMKHDKVFHGHNQGMSLYNNTLVILSVQHQTLHVYHINDGKFVKMQEIGRVCFVDDDFFLKSCVAHNCPEVSSSAETFKRLRSKPPPPRGLATTIPPTPITVHSRTSDTIPNVHNNRPYPVFNLNPDLDNIRSDLDRLLQSHDHNEGSSTIYSLKQKLLVHLFRQAEDKRKVTGNMNALRQFYMCFETYVQLRMLKMQLLSESTLLIKYASEEVVTLRSSEPASQPSYFVVYDFKAGEIINVYDTHSQELTLLLEQYTDYFRNPRLPCEPNYFCSPANNVHARANFLHHKSTLKTSKGGGMSEACKGILAQLPVACQAFSPSPYLDLGLFSYQDKFVSQMERPKPAADHPIRFFERDSGLYKFSLDASYPHQPNNVLNSAMNNRRLVAFTFHPTDPFAISIQKNFETYIVNFHLMHTPT